MPNFFGTFLKFASPSVLCYTTAMSDAGSQFPHLSVEGLIFPFPYSCSICKASSHSFDISSRPISRHKRVVFSVLILSNREMGWLAGRLSGQNGLQGCPLLSCILISKHIICKYQKQLYKLMRLLEIGTYWTLILSDIYINHLLIFLLTIWFYLKKCPNFIRTEDRHQIT